MTNVASELFLLFCIFIELISKIMADIKPKPILPKYKFVSFALLGSISVKIGHKSLSIIFLGPKPFSNQLVLSK